MRSHTLLASLIGLLVSFLACQAAHAQAVRTWVSGVGDDANPCSRTAPCKTFAGAISKTATNGEIDCLDPAGFGTVTIVKSITIDCTGTFGSILASGTIAININITDGADTLKTVRLRGLSINGTGSGTQLGIHGVSILAAAAVYIENVVISDFAQHGIRDSRTTRGSLYVKDSVIRNNSGIGILAAGTGGGTGANSIDNVHSINNNYGVAVGAGNNVKIIRSVLSGNSTAGIEADQGAQVGVGSSTVSQNSTGLLASGTIFISDTDITFNSTAMTGSVTSFGNNRIYGNAVAGSAPTVGAVSSDHGQQ
jgi:hypothetical protein